MSSLLIDLPSLQSAENLISLIHENDIDLLKFCLDKINTILPLYWPEFFESIIEIQNLAYNQNFIHKTLAALVAAKLFFYASDLDHALEFALLSDQLFDPYVSSEFNEAIMCILFVALQ
uniref:26S proteasome non-ATPase regulatory subunit 1 (Trinotate prediction) n=1 Tax=Henneguya salminicola TaxID=69463 RepID=A0A6G3MJ61_HENSL